VEERFKRDVWVLALKNAIEHGGRALPGPVISGIMGRYPGLRSRAREVVSVVNEVVKEVNKLSLEDQVRLAKERFPEVFEERRRRVEQKAGLPPLPNVNRYEVIKTRFAPNPDFLIHLGNARPAILSYEYARMYDGFMILRFEDTDPKTKPPMPEAYLLVKEDLRWLGVRWDEEYIQSLRIDIYYSVAKDLLRVGGAYVDLCSQEEFQKYKLKRVPCPHRDQEVSRNLELFDRMLEGYYGEGEAVVRVKTDLNHPDPSVRDWVAFRIIDTDTNPHPVTGSRYAVWPTYNFAAAVDDHLMGVTHILRGKEHMVNTVKQLFLYKHMNWQYPEVINLGRLKLEGFILSKSKIKQLLREFPDRFKGPSDVRFGTIASLRNRGIEAEAIRELIMEVGVKSTDASISWDNLSAINRKIIDSTTKRIMAVYDPVLLIVDGYEGPSIIKARYHPDAEELGIREIRLDVVSNKLNVYIEREDAKLAERGGLRLMELCNVKDLKMVAKDTLLGEFDGLGIDKAKRKGYQIIQWVSRGDNVHVVVTYPRGLELTHKRGIAERSLLDIGEGRRVQLIRKGFFKISNIRGAPESEVELIFIHQ